MKHTLFLALLTLVGGCVRNAAPPPAGGDDVNNGGNPSLRVWFQKAKVKLSVLLPQVNAKRDSHLLSEEISLADIDWIDSHRAELANEIEFSETVWTGEPQARCGSTKVGVSFHPILLSFRECLRSVTGLASAASVLVHEAIHHLGIWDEDRTDQLTALILELIPAANWQEQDGVLNPDREADLICEPSTPPGDGDWRVTVETFNGITRARVFQWKDGSYHFFRRFNCERSRIWNLESMKCGPPEKEQFSITYSGDSNVRLHYVIVHGDPEAAVDSPALSCR